MDLMMYVYVLAIEYFLFQLSHFIRHFGFSVAFSENSETNETT